jgi:hypothetical protein
LAISGIERWSNNLREKIERACFAHYLEHVNAIGARPPIVPLINAPPGVWSHIDIKAIRPFGSDVVVVYAVPDWDVDEQLEWCIQGAESLIYVGQVLCYDADGYFNIESGNSARNFEQVIAALGHLPSDWSPSKEDSVGPDQVSIAGNARWKLWK